MARCNCNPCCYARAACSCDCTYATQPEPAPTERAGVPDGIARLTYQVGQELPSEELLLASGVNFAGYERGMSDAITVIERRLQAMLTSALRHDGDKP